MQLDKLAKATDGWTGADLKALVTNAQLNAVHRLQKGAGTTPLLSFNSMCNSNHFPLSTLGLKHLSERKYLSIDQTDLIAALEETAPKAAQDIAQLSPRQHHLPVGQRVTLA